MPQPCHTIFLLDDTLRLILSRLDKNDLVTAACTCKAWKDAALDALWRDIQLERVLNVVCPLEPVSTGEDRFASLDPNFLGFPKVRTSHLFGCAALTHACIYCRASRKGSRDGTGHRYKLWRQRFEVPSSPLLSPSLSSQRCPNGSTIISTWLRSFRTFGWST